MVRTVADQAAEVARTNLVGPHPRDAGVLGPRDHSSEGQQMIFDSFGAGLPGLAGGPLRDDGSAEESTSPDGDMAFMGSIVQDEDLMIMMLHFGAATNCVRGLPPAESDSSNLAHA